MIRRVRGHVLGIMGFLLLLFPLIHNSYPISQVYAQTCGTGTNKATGLVSAPDIQNSFNTTGGCIKDPRAAFAPFTIPTYADLKSLYFDRSKGTKDFNTFTANSTITSSTTFTGDKVYLDSGDLTVSGTPTGTGTQVIFVGGDLNFTGNYSYNPVQGGTIFIVKGAVNFLQAVTAVNAVIIAEGIVCSAYDGANCPATNVNTQQLVINGSLISIDQIDPVPIKFKRSLNDNAEPAEKIIQQGKYLVLLKDSVSQTSEKWSEITGDVEAQVPSNPGAPSAPTNVTVAAINSNQNNISWTPGSNATSYKVFYCNTSASCSPATLAAQNLGSSPYSHTPLACGSTYRYKVVGTNSQGDSLDSNIASGPQTPACLAGAPVLANPTAGANPVVLNWTAPLNNGGSPITGYKIYRGTTSGAETLLASPAGTGTTYSDSQIVSGTPYFYQVSAVTLIGEGTKSNEVSVTPAAPACGSILIGILRTIGVNICF